MMKTINISTSIRTLFLIIMLAFTTNAYAEYAEHALIVHRLSNWAPDFLTVINNWDNMFFSSAPSTLKTLSVITEINGESTKDMEPNDFYAIIDKSDTFTISYISKIRGENKTYSQQLRKKRGYLYYKSNALYSFDYGHTPTSDANWWFKYYREKRYRDDMGDGPVPEECTTLMADYNIDFFNYCTFDYMVAGEDYMIDLGLVQALAKELEKKGLKYDSNNPDLHIYLTKNSSYNIESIYVPNIISTTKSSSSTNGHFSIYYGNYNTWGRGSSKTSGSSVTNTIDKGSSKTLVDGDLYLQASILDAKRMENPNPPVIWQMIFNRHYRNEFNALEEIKKLGIAMRSYPFTSKKIECGLVTFGIFFKDKLSRNSVVNDVVDGGFADEFGVKTGYVLKKIKQGDQTYYSVGKGEDPEFPSGYVGTFELIFDKIKIKKKEHSDQIYHEYFFINEKNLDE